MLISEIPLPKRPLRVSQDAIQPPRGRLLWPLVLLVLAGFLLWWQGPGLVRDWIISQNPVTLPQAHVANGECTTYRGLLTDCTADVSYSFKDQNWSSSIDIAFFSFGGGDYDVLVVISSDNPDLATLDLALDKLWNRTITLGLFLALVLGGMAQMLLNWRRASRDTRALSEPAILTLVPAAITNVQNVRGGQSWYSYKETGPGAQKGDGLTRMHAPDEPVYISGPGGEVAALAVRHPAARAPVLLDNRLARLDLTAAEREAMLAPFKTEAEATPASTAKSKGRNPVLRGLLWIVIVTLLLVAGVLGWWVYYVTASPDSHDSLGMEINNVMPAGLNQWGCDQLRARFGKNPPPFGCTGPDFTTWR